MWKKAIFIFVLLPLTVHSRDAFEISHPFRTVSKWLCDSDTALKGREAGVKRALLMLSKSQLVTKGVDGATFHLSASLGTGSAARTGLALELEKILAARSTVAAKDEETAQLKPGKPGVAAAKLVHKARTTQRALEAAELIELAALGRRVLEREGGDLSNDDLWRDAAAAAGVSLASPPICVPRDPLAASNGDVICFLLRDLKFEGMSDVTKESPKTTRLLLVFQDNISGACLIRNPLSPPEGDSEDDSMRTMGVPRDVMYAARHVVDSVAPLIRDVIDSSDVTDQPPVVHCVGFSFAGSVAAVACALLQRPVGIASASAVEEGGADSSGSHNSNAINRDDTAQGTALLVNAYHSCLALGPCPCAPAVTDLDFKGVTSLVLGDDMVARVQERSVRQLRERILRILPSTSSGVGAVAGMGRAWVKDSFTSASRNLEHRKTPSGTGGDSRAGVKDEDTLLSCPGVVYMLKPRASGQVHMVTTKRGGIGESLLWQLHDILISKSMLAHHTLPAYVRCLDVV